MSILDYMLDVCVQSELPTCGPVDEVVVEMMEAGKSIPCQCKECEGKQPGKPTTHVPYKAARQGMMHCKKCVYAFKCGACEKRCHVLVKATGLYKGSCIDCTRCEQCGVPMWDYICGQCDM